MRRIASHRLQSADFGRSRERYQTAGVDPTPLQHGICVGLIELELAERPKGTLTHHEVLSRRINIAEAALQRIGIEKCTAARGLKRNGRHALRHLGNVTGRGSHLGLHGGRRYRSRRRLFPRGRHDSDCQCARRRELELGLPECELKLRLRDKQ